MEKAERNREWVRLVIEDRIDAVEIAGRFGVSPQRVRKVLAREAPGALAALQAERLEQARRANPPPERETRECVICDKPFEVSPRSMRLTCSKEHSEDWVRLRRRHQRQTVPGLQDKHYDNVARTTLRHPANYGPAKVRWAARRLPDFARELGVEVPDAAEDAA